MKKNNKLIFDNTVTIKGLIMSFVLMLLTYSISAAPSPCSITKTNGGGFTTTITSVTQSGGLYTIVLTIEHDGCGGPACKELSHYSIEADNGTYSNVSWQQIWGDATMTGNIEMSLGNNDPFDGFKLDNVSNIGGGDAGEFTMTYTLTYLQDQQTLAKAGNNYTQIAAFTEAEFLSVLNCGGVNPPTAVDDNTTTPMNTAVDITEMANDIVGDAALDPTSITFIPGTEPNPATEGTFTVNPVTGVVTFTPVNGFTGTVTIDYSVCDLNSLCDIATITVVITPLTGPTAVDDNATTPMNTAVDITEMANDIEGDAALDPTSITFIPGTEPNPATEGLFTVNPVTGLVTFTPVNGFTGTVTIDYSVCDLNSLCDIATITVVITPLTGPTAVDDNATTPMNTAVDITEMANDIAGDAALDPTSITFIPGTEPNPATEGTFTVHPVTGLVTFTPINGYTGTVTIDYSVCDLNSLCDVATITVIIPNGTDTDGDGCPDAVDEYPNDPERCFDIYYPAAGNGTLAFEDLWPSKGDYDFNDLVIEYRFKTVMSGTNHIVETYSTFIVRAFGAGFENGFGFQLANNSIASADILSVSGYDIQETYVSLAGNGIEQGQTIPTIIVFDNAYNIMAHPGMGIGVNTEPWATYVQPDTLNMYMNYTQGTYTYSQLDIPNFNPFIMVSLSRGTEVHLPNYSPTSLANTWQLGTWDDDSDANAGRYYKTVSNLPWAIHIPEPFEWPIEKQDIVWVHLKFAEWAESGGLLYQDWYKDLPGYRNNSLIYDQP